MSRKSLLEAEAISEVLSDSNEIRTHNHLVRKGTLNHLAKLVKWLSSGFTLKHLHDMIRTCSQMHHADKYSQHSSVIWPVWLNGWVFVHKLSSCEFEPHCSHLNFGARACFAQGIPWNSGNCRMWIPSEVRAWDDRNLQLKTCRIKIRKTQRSA